MKVSSLISRAALAAVLGGGAWLTAGTAFAQEAAPLAPYARAHLIPVDVSIETGMHGDRYWDGHRYWAHDEWMRHHQHDRDPWGHDDDHRPPPPRHDEPRRY